MADIWEERRKVLYPGNTAINTQEEESGTQDGNVDVWGNRRNSLYPEQDPNVIASDPRSQWPSKLWPAEAVSDVADPRTLAKAPYTRPIVEGAATLAGGYLGGPLGAGAGYALSKRGMDAFEEYAGVKEPENRTEGAEGVEGATELITDIAKGAVIDKAGRLIGPTYQGAKKLLGIETDNTISSYLYKAIRPEFGTQKTWPMVKRYVEQAKEAVKSIIQRKPDLKLTREDGTIVTGVLPQTVRQFSEAIDHAKRSVFKEYDDMAKAAGQQGAEVDLLDAAVELDTIARNTVVLTTRPDTAKYAAEASERYLERGKFSSEEAQEAISHLNQSLDAFYKNPTMDTASKAYVDSMIANNIRKGLDDVIEDSVGEGYQKLKNTYGALKTVEKDVARRALTYDRQAPKGLIDFFDVVAGSQVVHGLASMNMGYAMAGASTKWLAWLVKRYNNPNRMIKNIFEDTEKMMKGGIGPPISERAGETAAIVGADVTGVGGMGRREEAKPSGEVPSSQDPIIPPGSSLKTGRSEERT
jgi:hypothetical protein